MKTLPWVLLVAATLFVACSGEGTTPARATASPVPTASPAIRTFIPVTPAAQPTPWATPTPGPSVTWDSPPSTGITHVDAIVAAVIAQRSDELANYLTGSVWPCVHSDPFAAARPPCLSNEPEGQLVPTIGSEGCPGDG